ncbi:MAG: hypothetical protein WC635_09330 [Bacteriovorax sp.]
MSSLLIKVTNNGVSKEYLLNTPGPVIVGSDKQCDVWIDDEQIEQRLLEIKLSAGQIIVKDIGFKSEININSIIPAFKQESQYREGDCINVKNTYYQIYIYKAPADTGEPPPFFENEFKERLARMDQKIREKELYLKELEGEGKKKHELILEMENKFQKESHEKNRLELELGSLRAEKENLTYDIRKSAEQKESDQQKSLQAADFIRQLQDEERTVKDKIDAHKQLLMKLKNERENKSLEVDQQRILLANLQLDAKRVKDELSELNSKHELQEKENRSEYMKTQKLIAESNLAFLEINKIQGQMSKVVNDKLVLENNYKDLDDEVQSLELLKKEAQYKLQCLRNSIDQNEDISKELLKDIQKQFIEKKSLADLNVELQAELGKLEEKLMLKKNQFDQTDFQYQDLNRKLSTVNFELEQANLRLKEIGKEERTQELKMLSIREDLQNLSRKAEMDKKQITKGIEDEKNKLNTEKTLLLGEISECEKMKTAVLGEQAALKGRSEQLETSIKALTQEKSSLESAVLHLKDSKSQMEGQIAAQKKSAEKLVHDTELAHRELSQLQIKSLDCEARMKEKLAETQCEIENFKRNERAKLQVEKEIQLTEVEAYKQKSLIEIESEYRRKLDDVHQMKTMAQEEADTILQTARQIETEITAEATRRLKEATNDAQEREFLSHKCISEAQEYYKHKEVEAESIINKARLESRDLMKKAELQLMEDLATRKQKIKKFLTMKQEAGTAHIKSLSEQSAIRLKRGEEKARQKLEVIKRSELKKIAKIREEEISRLNEIKANALKDFKIEKENGIKRIHELKKNQEAELAEKKKSVVDHINTIKIESQRALETELTREKELFHRSKKDRINNATQAVMNVLITEMGNQGENETQLREKIQITLEMAIDGQNADAINKVGQVLDFNPLNRKKIMPVLKKYSINFGVPAVLAIVILADIGSLRTAMIGQVKVLMKTHNSASEMYVNKQQTEWKERHTYNPLLTPGYKATFTDNIVYTTDFEKIMENEEFQNDWILKVHDFLLKDLELSEDIAINYISSEGALIKDLSAAKKELHPKFLDQGLKKMMTLEETHLGWLKQKLVKPGSMEKFLAFRRNNFDEFYYKQNVANRAVAAEKKP